MGSRSVPVGGAAVSAASEKLIDLQTQGCRPTGASAADIDFEHGRFHIVGTDRSTSFKGLLSAATGS